MIIYGAIYDELKKLPKYIREFFRDYLDIPEPLLYYNYYEVCDIMEFVRLEYPILSDNNVFGLLISISEGTPATFELPKRSVRRKFDKLMARYDIDPKYYHW